ncbi:glycoside hydrolase family 26 protein [Eubacterium ventriosum]|uniref:glycoside hydrolase family 26 protein n=1 Tax=Eubacterium ventriosum TaxID=39496 RepID=UPI0015F3ED1B|nr:glycosyl hydrolase [Eubacterium ventriosum]
MKIKLNKYTAVILVIIMISTIIYNENIIKADNMFSGNGSLNGWSYDDSWSNGTYTGAGSCVYDSDSNMMKVSLDYSGDSSTSWSQTGISRTSWSGIDFSEYTKVSIDLYYDSTAYTKGSLYVKLAADELFGDNVINIFKQEYTDMGNGKRKVNLVFDIDQNLAQYDKPYKFLVLFAGSNTDYKGDIYIERITMMEHLYVYSTKKANTGTSVTVANNSLNVNGEQVALKEPLKLVDGSADNDVINMYKYLQAVGQTGSTVFGHMDDVSQKAGSLSLSSSDTKDITGSVSGLTGFESSDCFSGYVTRYNLFHSSSQQLTDTKENNIKAAALMSNEAIDQGAIITLCSHMPNFSLTTENEGTFNKTYEKYEFGGSTFYILTGDVMNKIGEGGEYNEIYKAYLDTIAEYANQVNGVIIYRPFHECTGSWFWWGADLCTEAKFKEIFRYTVEYLRDVKGVHNMLYAYSPGTEPTSSSDIDERYPGDDYVDIIGFDAYDQYPISDETASLTGKKYTFQKTLKAKMSLFSAYAENHGKLFALTETGVANEDNKALLETGNERPDWFTEILNIVTDKQYNCCYFMLWTNWARYGAYYTPYVMKVSDDGILYGHELIDNFIDFYNNSKSIFANDQKVAIIDVGNTKEETTTVQPTTTVAPTTTVKPTTVKPTTVAPTTTTAKPTTVTSTTTTAEPTVQPTTVKQSTVQPTTVQTTAEKPTTSKMSVKLDRTKVVKAKKSIKKVKILLKKIKEAKGYVVVISKKRNFKDKVKMRKIKSNSVNFKGLKKNTNYYIKARAYTKINGETIYGKWSKKYKIRLKR